jgi:nucleoside-diphosphate-sugar epimerase
LQNAGATVVEGDIAQRSTLEDSMSGVDGVFHVVGWYEVGADEPSRGEQINVEGTRNVLEVMQSLDIAKGVFTSTLAVNSDTHGEPVDETYRYEGSHLTVYDRTKWKAHYDVVEPMVSDGLPVVTVLPGLVYGPDDPSLFGAALRDYLRGDLPVISGGVAYSPGHVADIARAHVQAMEHGTSGEAYIIGGEPTTLVDLFGIVADTAGRKPPRQ